LRKLRGFLQLRIADFHGFHAIFRKYPHNKWKKSGFLIFQLSQIFACGAENGRNTSIMMIGYQGIWSFFERFSGVILGDFNVARVIKVYR